jgi:hypothetical protein
MKQYVIDELRPGEYQRIKHYLDDHFGPPDMGDIYWIPLDESLYTELQAAHVDCRPLYFAVHLEPESLTGELLVRTRNRVRCDCIQYASENQMLWFIHFLDSIFSRLDIKT